MHPLPLAFPPSPFSIAFPRYKPAITMKFGAIVFAAVAAVVAAEGPVHLTEENFAATIEGKNALVKFQAPW